MKKVKPQRGFLLLFPILAIIYEILPYGAVLNFPVENEDGTINTVRCTFSYFDPIVFGYANFAPLITAILSCEILIIALFYFFMGKGKMPLLVSAGIAVFVSLTPVIYGYDCFSALGVGISIMLAAEFAAALIIFKKEEKSNE